MTAYNESYDGRGRPERRTPWEDNGGVSTVDTGLYQEAVASMRRDRKLTDVQRNQVINVIMEAKKAGLDTSCLDPTAPPNVRDPAFAEILRPAIQRGQISDVTLSDSETLRMLYNETLSWGTEVQKLLDDPAVTEVKIIGTSVLASSHRGLIVIEDAYASIEEPMSRVQALAQMLSVTWDYANPSVTLPLPHKTRLHATRHPMLAENDLLIVIRRGRQRPWKLNDLIERAALDQTAARVLSQLVQGSLSVIVSGPQDSGKTTMLECLLNTLPPDRHVILVEDQTDEFTLKSYAVSRLQVNNQQRDTQASNPFSVVVRETLRMTPDVLGPGEMRGEEAGAVAQIGESGKPTMTTIHARSPQAAVRRFARLAAADVPGNTFARQRDAAMEVIAESFHLVVHMVRSQRVQRRILQSVVLMNGLDDKGQPDCIPLIEARYDESVEGGVVWHCHARVEGDALVWEDETRKTPEHIRLLLQDALAPHAYKQPHVVAAGNQVAVLLSRARELLAYPDQAEQVVQVLEQALRLDPGLSEVWPLADRLLANNRQLRQQVEGGVATHVARLGALLERRDTTAARAFVAASTRSLLMRMVLDRDEQWNEQQRLIGQMEAQSARLQQALAEAHALAKEHGDLPQALQVLSPFDVRVLTLPMGRALVEARGGLLRGQLNRLRPEQADMAGRLRAQIALVQRDLDGIIALETAAATPSAAPQAPPEPAAAPGPAQMELSPAPVAPPPVQMQPLSQPAPAAAPQAPPRLEPAEAQPQPVDDAELDDDNDTAWGRPEPEARRSLRPAATAAPEPSPGRSPVWPPATDERAVGDLPARSAVPPAEQPARTPMPAETPRAPAAPPARAPMPAMPWLAADETPSAPPARQGVSIASEPAERASPPRGAPPQARPTWDAVEPEPRVQQAPPASWNGAPPVDEPKPEPSAPPAPDLGWLAEQAVSSPRPPVPSVEPPPAPGVGMPAFNAPSPVPGDFERPHASAAPVTPGPATSAGDGTPPPAFAEGEIPIRTDSAADVGESWRELWKDLRRNRPTE